MAKDCGFGEVLELVDKSANVLVTTHGRPDGDACGSVVALVRALGKEGKNVECLFMSEVPGWYRFLLDGELAVLGKTVSLEELQAGKLITPDLIMIVDTNSNNQLGQFSEYLKTNDKPVVIMDHHVTSDGLGDVEIKDTKAAAAGQIVLDFLRYSKYEVDSKIAEALFVAIATDTGWFRFSNVDSRVLADSEHLVKCGVKPSEIYKRLYQCFSAGRFDLMVRMLKSLELHFDGRYASQYLMLKDFEEAGADFKDTENLIDECQKIQSLEAAVLFVEQPDGRVKCSLRSMNNVDVRKIAQKFGGGGHVMAAGVFLDGPLEAAMGCIYAELEDCFKD